MGAGSGSRFSGAHLCVRICIDHLHPCRPDLHCKPSPHCLRLDDAHPHDCCNFRPACWICCGKSSRQIARGGGSIPHCPAWSSAEDCDTNGFFIVYALLDVGSCVHACVSSPFSSAPAHLPSASQSSHTHPTEICPRVVCRRQARQRPCRRPRAPPLRSGAGISGNTRGPRRHVGAVVACSHTPRGRYLLGFVAGWVLTSTRGPPRHVRAVALPNHGFRLRV